MTYEPQVDDYVIWKRPSGDWEEGWVYFKGDPEIMRKEINKDGILFHNILLLKLMYIQKENVDILLENQ